MQIRKRTLVLFALLLSVGAHAQDFDSYVVSQAMVPMRDSAMMATDIYRPARSGQAVDKKFPVVVERTPYNKSRDRFRTQGSYLARHGYIFVVQDCRGRFASEGVFYPFLNEGPDGFDTIEWAGTQSWSTGKVGTLGSSYMGWDQYLASRYRPPHLTAIFAVVGGANFYNEYAFPGGAPNLGWSLWIRASASSSPQAAEDPAGAEPLKESVKNTAAWLSLPPQKRGEVLRAFPSYQKVYEDYYNHPEFDAYWNQPGFYTAGYYKEMKDIPMMFVSGWYDYFAEGVLENFSSLAHLQKTPKKLLMGPWPHGTGKATCGDVAYGGAAAVDVDALAVDWFNRWLKDQALRTVGPEAVRFFRMGGGDGSRTGDGLLAHGGEWLTSSSWPPAELVPTKYYLRTDHVLSLAKPGAETPSQYVSDPDHPVPSGGGRYGGGISGLLCGQNQVCSPKVLGCSDSLPLDRRQDVLSFLTGPLDSPVEVTGKARSVLWVSSDAVDTDFTAKLMDVYPDGYALILAEGQIRARYREGFEKSVLMKPGKAYMVEIDLESTSNLFQKGHRIRLDVSSSNYPAREANPNTGEPAGSWTHRMKAQNTVYNDGKRASYVLLPMRRVNP